MNKLPSEISIRRIPGEEYSDPMSMRFYHVFFLETLLGTIRCHPKSDCWSNRGTWTVEGDRDRSFTHPIYKNRTKISGLDRTTAALSLARSQSSLIMKAMS